MKSKKIKILSGVCSFMVVVSSIFGNVAFAADPPSSRFSSFEDSDDDFPSVPAATAAAADIYQSTISSPENSHNDSSRVPAATAAAAAVETDLGDKKDKDSIEDYCQRMKTATEEEIFNEVNSSHAIKLFYREFCWVVCSNENISKQNKIKLLSYFTFVNVLNRVGSYTDDIKSKMNWETYSNCEGFYGKEFNGTVEYDGEKEKVHKKDGLCFSLVRIIRKNSFVFNEGKVKIFIDAMNFIGGLEDSIRFRGTDRDFKSLLGILEFVCYICGDACYECGRAFSISEGEIYTYKRNELCMYVCCDECFRKYCKRCGIRETVSPQ